MDASARCPLPQTTQEEDRRPESDRYYSVRYPTAAEAAALQLKAQADGRGGSFSTSSPLATSGSLVSRERGG